MTTIQPFEATDLLNLNAINLDIFTENFPLESYLEYLILWPTLFFKSVELTSHDKNERISGYMMGKTEGRGQDWHSHITAVTISPKFRRISLASMLCNALETITDDKQHQVNFIDLFVKCNNALAIKLYEKLGYGIYRRVVGYYNSPEDGYPRSLKKINDDKDAFDMRKGMVRDHGRSTRPEGWKQYCFPHDIKF
ncbi:HDL031Wp [Eremothecium sinecaudum]|uniref:HDL031Wp n=1 Tax=Eremothecium sinecaudum TaxID=45286 RepID=A0A109UZ89_9SACH|nr:HDL031Wp [Eremothecium sinecaudum]AMD20713.1 HDL031Wp [Eremothecium sinecaudum]